MKAEHVWHKPAELSFEQAAALPLAGLTANDGINTKGKTSPGDRVLILGASGGVGSYAVQLAKAAGARVSAVCSARNAAYVRGLGADEVWPYDPRRPARGLHATTWSSTWSARARSCAQDVT